MWVPDPTWEPLRGGPSSHGLWRAARDDRAWVVKRLPRPGPDEAAYLDDPRHPGYWRREADAVAEPGFADGPGVVPVAGATLEEDEHGVTLWSPQVDAAPPTGLLVARCLGRFAPAPPAAPRWAARDQLRTRLAYAAARGGWRTLARTTLADVTDVLWRGRGHWLDRLDRLPQGRVHGDVVPANLLSGTADEVVATDWQCLGIGPVGADLGYWTLSRSESFEVLLDAFVEGAIAVDPRVDAEAAATAARVTAVYTVLGRAEWALARAAAGEGALAGKFRHPSVAPYLRAVQRQFPQIEALLG